jgi:hypothetical protein
MINAARIAGSSDRETIMVLVGGNTIGDVDLFMKSCLTVLGRYAQEYRTCEGDPVRAPHNAHAACGAAQSDAVASGTDGDLQQSGLGIRIRGQLLQGNGRTSTNGSSISLNAT